MFLGLEQTVEEYPHFFSGLDIAFFIGDAYSLLEGGHGLLWASRLAQGLAQRLPGCRVVGILVHGHLQVVGSGTGFARFEIGGTQAEAQQGIVLALL